MHKHFIDQYTVSKLSLLMVSVRASRRKPHEMYKSKEINYDAMHIRNCDFPEYDLFKARMISTVFPASKSSPPSVAQGLCALSYLKDMYERYNYRIDDTEGRTQTKHLHYLESGSGYTIPDIPEGETY